jgi:hypothetical protein
MSGAIRIKQGVERLLLVEGKDEELLFPKLLANDSIQVIAYNGKDKLGLFLENLKVAPSFSHIERIVVTRDNDLDPNAAAQAVEGFVTKAGLEHLCRYVPIPAPNLDGALEALWIGEIPQAQRACIDAFGACMPFKATGKAVLNAYLIAKEPGATLHQAIERSALTLRPTLVEPLLKAIADAFAE